MQKQIFTLLIIVFTVCSLSAGERPNILWISLEDISPDLGCYGDTYAVTPVIDRLATQGVRYTRAFTHAGVCAPSRSGIITGCYPPSITTQHMRCQGVPPAEVRCFTEYLRAAGYYCTNNSKTDYQFQPPATAWDENGNQAHYRNRQPGQPFFAVFNLTNTHESQVRNGADKRARIAGELLPEQRRDPARAILPPYYPDTPIIRADWVSYYQNLTWTERLIDKLLKDLEADGLADDTIVWFWGDHGRGLPRGKRWLYDSGTRIPLIVRVPEKWRKHVAPTNPDAVKPGTVNDDLVAAVDFAPTMLSLCGVELPKYLQGQAFLGRDKPTEPRKYIYGHRDRMDERYDLIRMVRDTRYKYIRNFMPHLPYAQNIGYMNEMPTMREWRRLAAEGKLTGPQKIFFAPFKPLEELYDTQVDPHEVDNLAGKPEHAERLKAMRGELYDWMQRINDTGFLAEADLERINHPDGKSPTTFSPVISSQRVAADNQSTELRLMVPGGGSVAYQIVTPGTKQPKTPSVALDTTSVTLRAGETLVMRGVRIGCSDSTPVRWKLGDPEPPLVKRNSNDTGFLCRRYGRDTLAALLNVDHKLLAQADKLRTDNFFPLSEMPPAPDPAPGPLGELQRPLRNAIACYNARWMTYAGLVKPDNPLNRSLAAPTAERRDDDDLLNLCEIISFLNPAEHTGCLPHLDRILNESDNKFLRLRAALILDQLGESARPALKTIRANADAKNNEYIGRVCSHILQQLKAGSSAEKTPSD